jgi:hypothetical protein
MSTENLFTAAEVSKASGVDVISLKALEPAGFGVPGHWRLVGSQVVYTEKGCRELIASFEANRMPVAATCLRVFLSQRIETPSRALPIKPPGEPWYNKGAMA